MFLAAIVLLMPNIAFSINCIDIFKVPQSLETLFTLEDIDQIQYHSLQHINMLANKINNSKDPTEKKVYISQLQQSWDMIKSWDRLRNYNILITEQIIAHFEKRLKLTITNSPALVERLYGDRTQNSSFSTLNFDYQLPFILDSLKIANMTLKEVPHGK